MGAYQVWHIEFKDKKTRDRFEKTIKLKRLFQYHDNDESYECTYYVGWESYGHGCYFLEKNKWMRPNIIKFKSMDLSTQGDWFDELK